MVSHSRLLMGFSRTFSSPERVRLEDLQQRGVHATQGSLKAQTGDECEGGEEDLNVLLRVKQVEYR